MGGTGGRSCFTFCAKLLRVFIAGVVHLGGVEVDRVVAASLGRCGTYRVVGGIRVRLQRRPVLRLRSVAVGLAVAGRAAAFAAVGAIVIIADEPETGVDVVRVGCGSLSGVSQVNETVGP